MIRPNTLAATLRTEALMRGDWERVRVHNCHGPVAGWCTIWTGTGVPV